MIDPTVLAEIKGALSLVSIVSEHVELKSRGKELIGCCPFHEEKSGSFTVTPETGLYYCFGCGEGGDLVKFTQKISGMSFMESIQHLADRAGVTLPTNGKVATASWPPPGYKTAKEQKKEANSADWEAIMETTQIGSKADELVAQYDPPLVTAAELESEMGIWAKKVGSDPWASKQIFKERLAQEIQHRGKRVNKMDPDGLSSNAAELRRRIIEFDAENNAYEKALKEQSIKKEFGITHQALQELVSFSRNEVVQKATHIQEIAASIFNQVERRASGEEPAGISTGFNAIDTILTGLKPSTFYILAGRPSVGKTAAVMAMAANIAKDKRVLVFSLEQSKDQLIYRMVSSVSSINYTKLDTGDLKNYEWEAFSKSLDTINQLDIEIDDAGERTTDSISRSIALQATLPDLVIIDHLQLIEGTGENETAAMTRISKSLKNIAKKYNIPVLVLSQLSRSVEQRQDKRPMMSDLRSSGCLTGDTLITMAESGQRVRIDSLVGKSDFDVLSVNEKTMRIELAKASHAFCSGVKPTFELVTKLGRRISATANHKFFTISGWKPLSELLLGEHIALPRILPSANIQTMSDAELALLGQLIGDGCTLPKHALQYTTGDLDLAELVSDLSRQVFGDAITPRINPERTWYQVYLSSTRRLGPGSPSPLTKWLKNLGAFGFRSYEKSVPTLVFDQPKDAIAVFLKNLWSTDGCISISGEYPAIYFGSSSSLLSMNVQSLLLRFGINSILRVVPQKNGKDQHCVYISGQAEIVRFLREIGSVKKSHQEASKVILESLSKTPNTNRDVIPRQIWEMLVVPKMNQKGITFRDFKKDTFAGINTKTNFGREKVSQFAQILDSKELANLANSDIYWDEISKIEPNGTQEVFDITVPRLHNFIANDIIVHNSIEQDSDVIILMYRDEYYNPNTPDRGVVEFNIAKNRNGPTGMVKLLFESEFVRFRNYNRT